MVDVLLDAGADASAKTVGGVTPLHVCALHRHDEPMVALLKRGGKVDDEQDNNNGLTALHWVCIGCAPGTDKTVDLLLRWGASETALDTRGETPSDHLRTSAAAVSSGDVTPRNWEEMQREMQRALVLLARAPADRAWRRRCWLVMLRARAGRERETLVGHDEDDGSYKVGETGAGGSGSGPMDGERGGAGRVRRRMAAGEGGLRGLVPALLGMNSDGVFSTVVCDSGTVSCSLYLVCELRFVYPRCI